MTDEKNTTTGSPYAPWDLRRLPNFDFSEYLRKVEKPDGKGQTVEMTLESTKRWFRLACPNGGLVLNPLRVADTMAIFEARVFADAGDRNPLASFTAAQSSKPAADTAPRPAPVGPPPHEDAAPRPASVGSQSGASGENRPAPVGPQPHAAPSQEKGKPAPAVVNIGDARQTVAAENKPDGQVETDISPVAATGPAPETPPASHAAPAAASAPEAAVGETKPAAVTYTPDMPVDEICLHMTLEQAKAVKVLDGTCKGWTLAQVAKDRPTSLRWLQSVCPFADNELKAAATVVLNDLELRKAG